MGRHATSPVMRRHASLRAFALVLMLPFALLSLIAQGSMVVAGPVPATFMVVLCGDDLPVEMTLDDDGNVVPLAEYHNAKRGPDAGVGKQPCIWSAHAQPMLDVGSLPDGATLANISLAAFVPARDLHTRRAEVLTPLARGPPAA